ncbi:hypothetical protein FSP39_004183 [Pinctada imbricata]|uniref:Glycosyl transferase family 1 domain-containing protein n=1 Tax=Pinctada imbricata TaxID=66713 RepID=A0AA88YLK6_PINIB|nr:hypothetical protein FSP39_004183 [Pinctada imbricata]
MPDTERKDYKLILVGSCRNEEDSKRVENLKELCRELGISEYVEFELNVSFDRLKELMSESVIGLHTMWNEHFGIGVVEMMAAGTIVLAHDSGGPKLDIVVPVSSHKTGFLANDVESYAVAMETIFNLSNSERLEIRKHARESISRFSEKEFNDGFIYAFEPLMAKA